MFTRLYCIIRFNPLFVDECKNGKKEDSDNDVCLLCFAESVQRDSTGGI